ncbi:sel1 repeat family protein [Asticcacaulis biprosthecium C19]|uniref:Sel1 repeat family protein n=1 Tax=Asticcacaulis biprosthecium C19 TaxID=715226 RepID=F4QHN5_9CAUL|nr:tetratricopeptide repeat protein [Asticcacaulis biprosthecium]EGF92772.1 sel1 repeat family protein [Asticcacaulis biprosthecium C19]
MQDPAASFSSLDPIYLFIGLVLILCAVLWFMVRDLIGHRLDWSRPLTPFQYKRRLARRGDARACVACADMLEKGTGGAPRHPELALSFLDQALYIYERDAKKGDGYAWLKIGEILSRGHHVHNMPNSADRAYHNAYLCNLEAAKAGDINGLAFAGYQLRFGLGCVTDLHKAMDFLEAAANRGHAPSIKSLAELHLVGVRGKPDPVSAARLFRQAAAVGDAEALERVGDNFLSATGELASREQAYFWYASAARKGRSAAQRKMERLEETWTPKQLRDVQDRLQTWAPA